MSFRSRAQRIVDLARNNEAVNKRYEGSSEYSPNNSELEHESSSCCSSSTYCAEDPKQLRKELAHLHSPNRKATICGEIVTDDIVGNITDINECPIGLIFEKNGNQNAGSSFSIDQSLKFEASDKTMMTLTNLNPNSEDSVQIRSNEPATVDIENINEFIYVSENDTGYVNNGENNNINFEKTTGDSIIVFEKDTECATNIDDDKITTQGNLLNDTGKIRVLQNIQLISNNQPVTEPEPSTSKNNELTKRGLKRKRKTFDTPLMDRKQAKLDVKRESFKIKPPCSDKCIKKCKLNMSEKQREIINNEYWKMDWIGQRHFIISNTQTFEIKRKKSSNSARNKSHCYYLKNEKGENVQVCKPFFLTTLGFKSSNDKVVFNALSNTKNANNIAPKPDMRGKKSHPQKVNRCTIQEHILSFHPCVSHYRREHAPKRRYLPSEISVTFMYKDYIKKNPDKNHYCSYDLYRSVVKDLNISFAKLGNEECEECTIFSQHGHTKDSLDSDCEKCTKYSNHIERADNCRKMYRQDANFENRNSDDVVYSADLQKVIMLPRIDQFKIVIFTRRIVLFNESFVPVGTKQTTLKPIAAIWHEGVAGRKKEDIISAFNAFFLSNRDAIKITLWLDNCSAQNKNWCFLTYLIYIVNSTLINAKEIDIKYFEPGHTFMSADSFHHQVEQSMKKRNLYDFNDFKQSVQEANSGKVNIKDMAIQDFHDWKDCASQVKLRKTEPRPYLNNMVRIVATRGHNTLKYWKNFNESCLELNFLNSKTMKLGITSAPEARKINRGINKAKKTGILEKLCPLMPASRLEFWKSLKEDDVADLNETQDE